MHSMTAEAMSEEYRDKLETAWLEGSRELAYDVWRSYMEKNFKTVIKKHLPDLAKNISTDSGFMGYLQCKLVFDRRSIDSFQRKQGRYDQLSAVLNAFGNKPFQCFLGFCEVLIVTNQMHVILEYLTPDELGTRLVKAVAADSCIATSSDENHQEASKKPDHVTRQAIQFDWRSVIRVNLPRLVSEIQPDDGFILRLADKGIISETNVDVITSIKGRSNRVEAILNQLTMLRPDEDFLKFCEVLLATNQEHIVAQYLTKESASSPLLRRSEKIDRSAPQLPQHVSDIYRRVVKDDGWKKALTNRRSTLVEQMEVSDELISKLQKLGVMNQNTGERLQEESVDYARAESLVNYMYRRSGQDFGLLCQALYETGQNGLVDLILMQQLPSETNASPNGSGS